MKFKSSINATEELSDEKKILIDKLILDIETIGTRVDTLEADNTQNKANIANKVDKIEGKGLSANDYTDEEKEKLASLENYDDTAIKSDIADIKTKDIEQDNSINSNAEKISKLQSENTLLRSQIPVGKESGESIYLTDSSNMPLKSLKIRGNREQDATSGKNLLEYPYAETTKTNNGITFTDNGDGTITVNGTSTATAQFNFKINNKYKLSPGEYYINLFGGVSGNVFFIVGSANSGNAYTPTSINNNTKFIYTDTATDIGYCILQVPNGKTFNNLTIKPMISNTQVTDYEPYTGGQPSPNPDYPQPISVIENSLKITICNKNLFNDEEVSNIWVNQKGTIYNFKGANAKKYACKSGDKFKIYGEFNKAGGSTILICAFYDKQDNLLKRSFAVDSLILSLNEIAPTNTSYAYIGRYTNKPNKIYVYKNIEDTLFEEHQETTITFDIPEGEFVGKINDTYKDELTIEYNEEDGQWHKKLYKNIGKVVLDGSESGWWLQSGTQFRIPLENSKAYGGLKSNYFINSEETTNGHMLVYNDGYLKVHTEFTSLDDFKTWLSTHNTEVYYTLANPYVLDLGVIEPIELFKGYSNIELLADIDTTFEVEYYKDLEALEKQKEDKFTKLTNAIIALGGVVE